MNIVIVTRFPIDTSKPKGGVEAVSLALVKALASDQACSVRVLTFCHHSRTEFESTWKGASIHRIPNPKGSELRVAIGAGKKLLGEKIRSLQPDIIHSHDTYGMMMLDWGIPSVFTVHGFIHGDIRVSSAKWRIPRSLIWKFFETKGWRRQSNIIAISPYVRERLAPYFHGRVYDIDNPIDESFFNIRRQPEEGRVFSSAAICRRKNQLAVIKAIKQCRDAGQSVRLYLAGEIAEQEYFSRLTNYIERYNLGPQVSFLGQISVNQIRRELASCSVFVLTSREENSPMSIEEAMALGVPVISSNRCGMPYMVRHGESGLLIDPEDPGDIASALQKIISNAELATKMSTEAIAIATARFHPNVVAERTKLAYREIIDKWREKHCNQF